MGDNVAYIPPYTVEIDASVNNIPAAPSTAAGSRIATSLSEYYTHLKVANNTANNVHIVTKTNDAGTPTAGDTARLIIEAGTMQFYDDLKIFPNAFIWTPSGATSLAKVSVTFW